MTFSAIPAMNINKLPPGKLGFFSSKTTKRRPIRIFFKKSNIPPNNPFAGAVSFLTRPLPFVLGVVFSNIFSCFFLLCFSSDFLSFFDAAFCCARVPLRTLSISITFALMTLSVSSSLSLPFIDAISAPEIGVIALTSAGAGIIDACGLIANAPPFSSGPSSSPPFFLIASGFTFFFLPVIKSFALSLATFFAAPPKALFATPPSNPANAISDHR